MKIFLQLLLIIILTIIIIPVSLAQEPLNKDINGVYGYNELYEKGNEELKEIILLNTTAYFNEYYKCLEKLSVSRKLTEYSVDNNNMYFFLKLLELNIYSIKASGSEIKNPYIDNVKLVNSVILENGDVKADIY